MKNFQKITVTSLNLEKGFGFGKSQDGKNVFFHKSSFSKREWSNMKVGYTFMSEIEETTKGFTAKPVNIEYYFKFFDKSELHAYAGSEKLTFADYPHIFDKEIIEKYNSFKKERDEKIAFELGFKDIFDIIIEQKGKPNETYLFETSKAIRKITFSDKRQIGESIIEGEVEYCSYLGVRAKAIEKIKYFEVTTSYEVDENEKRVVEKTTEREYFASGTLKTVNVPYIEKVVSEKTYEKYGRYETHYVEESDDQMRSGKPFKMWVESPAIVQVVELVTEESVEIELVHEGITHKINVQIPKDMRYKGKEERIFPL